MYTMVAINELLLTQRSQIISSKEPLTLNISSGAECLMVDVNN